MKLAKDKKTGERYAVKIIDKSKTEEQDSKRLDVLDQRSLLICQTEVEILKKVKHENIIKLIDLYDTKDNLFLVMDL